MKQGYVTVSGIVIVCSLGGFGNAIDQVQDFSVKAMSGEFGEISPRLKECLAIAKDEIESYVVVKEKNWYEYWFVYRHVLSGIERSGKFCLFVKKRFL